MIASLPLIFIFREGGEALRAAIMVETLEKVAKERPEGIELEREARAVGQRCGARVREKSIALERGRGIKVGRYPAGARNQG